MNIIDFIIILPEFAFINYALVLLWAGLYLRYKLGNLSHANSFNYFSVYILVFLFIFLMNNPFFETTATLSGSFETSSWILLLKLLTISLAIFFLLSVLEVEASIISANWGVEIYTLRLLLLSALFLLISASDLIYFWLVFEVYSLVSYVLIGYRDREAQNISAESAIKYFILGTIFSILMLYSIALIYSGTGLTNFSQLEVYFLFVKESAFSWKGYDVVDLAVFILLVSILFKLAAAPFHFWAPDVYDGCPTSTMSFLFVVPKLILFGVLIKLSFFWSISILVSLTLLTCSILSLIVGSLGGLFSLKVKRLLVYSSISNTGYFLLTLFAGTTYNFVLLLVFLIVYSLSSLGIFTLLQNIKFQNSGYNLKNIWAWSNLFFTNKSLAVSLMLILFSSAGIPPLVGFIVKFLLLLSLVSAGSWFIIAVIIILLLSSISCFYYIRLVKTMAFSKKKRIVFLKPLSAPAAYIVSAIVASLFVLFLTSGLLTNLIILYLI